MIEETDQRRLAAEVELQRLLFTTVREQRCRHLAKDVNVSATETVNRLLALADDEQGGRTTPLREGETFEQPPLHGVRVLKLVDEKESIALRGSREHFRSLQQRQRSQFQVVEIKRRQLLLLFVESLNDAQQQVDHFERVLPRKQIKTNLRHAALQILRPDQFVEHFHMISHSTAKRWSWLAECFADPPVTGERFV